MRLTFALAAFAVALGSLPASAAGVDKLYVLYCVARYGGADQSRWSPGVNVGVPIELSDNCYLIHHDKGWFLWDTGLDDTIAAKPDGVTAGNGALHMKRTKTLAAQLEALGVKPADIKGMAISHTHPDHVGNIEEFPQTMLYVQKAEYDWPAEGGGPRFKPEHPVTKLDGDYDIFGDGSVMIISTPGHTPGHQSLLVRLPKTWRGFALRRRGSLQGQLGQSARAWTELQQGTVAGFAAEDVRRFSPRSTLSSGSTTTSRRAMRRKKRPTIMSKLNRQRRRANAE